jgi:hypothetical protein
MIEINGSKCICTYSRNKILMNRRTIFFSGMFIAAVSIFFGSGHIGNQQAIAFGGFGHGFGHSYGPGFGHLYRPGFGYYYSPGYVIDNPCDGGPYSIIDGQAVCTTG